PFNWIGRYFQDLLCFPYSEDPGCAPQFKNSPSSGRCDPECRRGLRGGVRQGMALPKCMGRWFSRVAGRCPAGQYAQGKSHPELLGYLRTCPFRPPPNRRSRTTRIPGTLRPKSLHPLATRSELSPASATRGVYRLAKRQNSGSCPKCSRAVDLSLLAGQTRRRETACDRSLVHPKHKAPE